MPSKIPTAAEEICGRIELLEKQAAEARVESQRLAEESARWNGRAEDIDALRAGYAAILSEAK